MDPLTTTVRLVWPFLELARKQGHDVSTVAERLGVSARELEDPETRVSQQLVAKLLQGAVDYIGRDLGLMAAEHADSRNFGIGEYVARTRPTLRSAVECYDRYLPLLGDSAGVSTREVDDHIVMRLWFSPALVIHEAAYEFALAIGVLRARRVTGNNDLTPRSVHFMHARPANIERHQRLFRCPVYFGSEMTQVVVPKAALELKLPGREPVLGELLVQHAEAMLDRLACRDDICSRVESVIAANMRLSEVTVERVAKRLGMSARTLARRLDAEGTSFRELFDQIRNQVAQRELLHGSRTLAAVSEGLGFSNVQAFHRAFKRWTGETPASFRTAVRARRSQR